MINNNDDRSPTLEKYMSDKVGEVIEELGILNADIDVKFALAKGENFLGDIYKIEANGMTKDQQRKKLKLILKAANSKPNDSQKDFLAEFYSREIMAYTLVFPIFHSIENECALGEDERFYHAEFYGYNEESFKRMIIMNDITENGFRMGDKFKSIDYEHASLVVKFLAKFHAISFVYRQKDEKGFNELVEKITLQQETAGFESYGRATLNMAVKLVEDDEVCKVRMENFVKNIFERMAELTNYKNLEPYYAICHGDCWNNNFMFKYEGDKPVDVVFLDWQLIKANTPVMDLSYVLSVNTDEEFRDAHLMNILNLYYENLDRCIRRFGFDTDILYPRRIFEEHIKNQFNVGLMIAIYVLPFIMTDKEEILDAAVVSDDNEDAIKRVTFSKKAEERLKGLIKDCVKFNFI